MSVLLTCRAAMSWGAGRNRSMRGEEIITKNKKLVEEQFPRKKGEEGTILRDCTILTRVVISEIWVCIIYPRTTVQMLTNSVPCDYVHYFYLLFFHSDVTFLFSNMYLQNTYSFSLFCAAKISTIFSHFWAGFTLVTQGQHCPPICLKWLVTYLIT